MHQIFLIGDQNITEAQITNSSFKNKEAWSLTYTNNLTTSKGTECTSANHIYDVLSQLMIYKSMICDVHVTSIG